MQNLEDQSYEEDSMAQLDHHELKGKDQKNKRENAINESIKSLFQLVQENNS